MNIRKVVYRVSCEMIYELMQRDLDHDLTHVEKQRLLTHLASCAQCSDLYERLYSLSAHLAQLPAVEPPVSIVQSIMPRLDEIDSMKKAEHGEQAAASEAAGENVVLHPKRKQFWFRSFAGAAAAAAVLTVTIWNMDESPLQQTAFSPTHPQVQEQISVKKTDKPSPAQPSSGGASASGTPISGESQVPSAVPDQKQPSVTEKAGDETGSNTVSSADKAKGVAGDDHASGVAKNSPTASDEKTVADGNDKQGKAQAEEKAEKPSDDSKATTVAEQQPENRGVPEPEAPRPDLDAGKRNMMVGFVAQGDAEKKTENHATVAETEKMAVPRAVQEEYFVSKNGNRLIVRDGGGEIRFATHDWGDMYGVSYRWVGTTRILYTLDYQGAGMDIGPRPQTQEWLIDLNKNIERPLFK